MSAIVCVRCKNLKDECDFRVMKNRNKTKTCINCLQWQKEYRDKHKTVETFPQSAIPVVEKKIIYHKSKKEDCNCAKCQSKRLDTQ